MTEPDMRERLARLMSETAQPDYVWGDDPFSDMTAFRMADAVLAALPEMIASDAMIAKALDAVKQEHARFMFGDDAIANGFTFENSFKAEFRETFAQVQARHLKAAVGALLAAMGAGK